MTAATRSARHARRRGRARPRRHRLARARQARRRRRLANGQLEIGRRRRPGPGARPLGSPPGRPALRRRRGGRPRRPARPRRRGRDRAATTGVQARRFALPPISTHVLDTARGRPAEGVRVELFRGDELLASRRDRRRRPHPRPRRRRAGQSTGSSSIRLRRSSAASTSSRARARATTTSRCSSRPTGARPTAAADGRRARRALRGADALRRAAGGDRGPARPARTRSRAS